MNPPATDLRARPTPTPRWAIGAIALLAIVVLYHNAFRMLPAGDDWTPPLSEIYRARTTGLWSIIRYNAWQHPMWRPLQSFAFIALGRMPGDLLTWVTALNFTCVIVAIIALLCWAREIDLPPIAVLAAGLAFAAHPVNVAAIASNDGFGSTLTPAVAWLLAWTMYRLRDRPWLAIAIAAPAMALASGVKEYVFAFVPMACAVTLLTYARPIRWTVIVGAILSVETAGLLAVRKLLVPLQPVAYLVAPPPLAMMRRAVSNTLMGVGAAATPSNTITFFTTDGHARLVVIALGALLTGVIACAAAVLVIRRPSPGGATGVRPPVRGALLVALLTLGSLFPANVATRMSEMYLLGLGIGVSLIIGIAVREAMLARASIVRVAVLAACIAWIAWASTSTLAKVAEMRRSGELSFALGKFLGDTLPPQRDVRVAMLYDDAACRRVGFYSVFRVPRNGMVLSETIQYFRPDAPGKITNFRVGSPDEVPLHVDDFDAIIAWDVEAWTGHYLKR